MIEVSEDDLPAFCPNPDMPLWSWHPRIYLDVVHEGEAMCPYCGTRYRLAPAGTSSQRSMTTSPSGREQQMSTLPEAGSSSGSGR